MNKKIILIAFVLAMTTGGLFGAYRLMNQKPQPPRLSMAIPTEEIIGQAPVKTDQYIPTPAIQAPAPSANTPTNNPNTVSSSVAQVNPLFTSMLSPAPDARSAFYEIKSGDNLTTIAKKNATTVDLIKRVNGLSGDKIFPGKKLKIPSYKFSVVVDKSQNVLILKGDEEVLKTYVVSTGTDNSTPVGVFKITTKLVDPTWYKAGAVVAPDSPENVLGTRWMGIDKVGYGIHGTTEPDKLGQQVTAGCVRMRNDEAEELYAFVIPGTEVTIVD